MDVREVFRKCLGVAPRLFGGRLAGVLHVFGRCWRWCLNSFLRVSGGVWGCLEGVWGGGLFAFQISGGKLLMSRTHFEPHAADTFRTVT